VEWVKEFTTEREAVAHVAECAHGGLRFHDLRHSYVTWLVSDGVPINAVQKVMGHEQASTTLNRYTHAPDDYAARMLAAFEDPAASTLPQKDETDTSHNGEEEVQADDLQSRSAAPCASSRPAHVAWCHPIRTAVVPGADFLLIHGAPTLAPRCAAALVRSLT
jgi:hypothetical protein